MFLNKIGLPLIRATRATKRTVAIMAACLLLVAYIGFLMISNYRKQIALQQSALESFQLDMEKNAASFGYFFSERKYDLRSLASSREISSYFINKSLGMSEEYGLKVSLFVISQIFQKTILQKDIHGHAIYEYIVFTDAMGHQLLHVPANREEEDLISWEKFLTPESNDPIVFVENEKDQTKILLAIACFFNGQYAGEIMASLNLTTLFNQLFNFSSMYAKNEIHLLATNDGRLVYSSQGYPLSFNPELTPEKIFQLPVAGFASKTFFLNSTSAQEMLGTRRPISNTSLNLLAWVPREKIFGTLTPGQLLVGTGSLAVVILLGVGLLIMFNTQNLILKARYDESERQQGLLAEKNLQLEVEISKRFEAERTLEAQRILSIRSDRLRSLGEMAAGIAHELNQPLVGVRGLAELILLSREKEEVSPGDKLRKNASLIVAQADRMAHIIKHVRLFAREAGNPETSVADLNEIVNSAINLLTAQFTSHGLLLESKIALESLSIRVNPFSVEEVMLNLLSNARDAVEKRKREEGPSYIPQIIVSTGVGKSSDHDVVWVELQDNGSGIPSDIADKVFDPFFTTKDPDKGTGLGLSICKSIVEQFGGSIQFVSGSPAGTSFKIHFPVYAREKEDQDGTAKNFKGTRSR